MSYYENLIAKLKARIEEMSRNERMKAIPVEKQLIDKALEFKSLNLLLKAENFRLKEQVNYWRIEAETDHARWLRVLEDNERLRKAGDAMANALNLDDDVFDNHDKKEAQSNWNAAKDGKPSA